MNNIQLYINDELVDLSDDSPIALTFQINNLAEVKNQQGNTSNQFKLPLTQRNRRILGFPDEVAFTNELPYRQYQTKLVQDGLEIIPYGIGELNGIEQDTAAITILSGNVDFFDAVDYKIYDMGDGTTNIGKQTLFKSYEHEWTVANVVASQTKTSGWIWPVVDYGKIPDDFTTSPSIDIRNLRPGFFLKTAVDAMVKSAGYKIDPDSFLVKDEIYDKLIVQFANDSFDHGTEVQNGDDGYSVEVKSTVNHDFNINTVDDSNSSYLQFDDQVQDKSTPTAFHFTGSTYVAPTRVTVTVTVSYSLVLIGQMSGKNQSKITIGIRVGDGSGGFSDVISAFYDLTDGAKNLGGGVGTKEWKDERQSFDLELNKGQSVVIFYVLQNKKATAGAIYAGAHLVIKSKSQKVLLGQKVQCERIFPDIGAKDLLKDTFQKFGIICQTNNTNRTIRLASFRDIVNNIPRANDWTTKCLDQGKSISFQLGGYAQINYMKYKQDDAITPVTLGQSQINVDDKTLPASADLFESQFAPTLYRPYIGGTIAQIIKIDQKSDSSDFTLSTAPRLLIDDKLKLSGQSVIFTDGEAANNVVLNDTLAVPYFDKPGGKYSLLFEQLRLKYYPELEKILYRSKKVIRYFLLTPRDILELDLLIPVYLQQDGAYYYINKIDSWRKGQPVKVELVKLG